MYDDNFQNRIQYKGELKPLLENVCGDYNLGSYSTHKVITVGYEDLNIILTTDKERYFVKVFADFRNAEDCKRYVEIMQTALEAGVHHPTLYKYQQGNLYETTIDSATIRLCVLQFIEGNSFYSLQEQPTMDELRILAQQAAIINQMEVKPEPVYDSWAVVNFVSQSYGIPRQVV